MVYLTKLQDIYLVKFQNDLYRSKRIFVIMGLWVLDQIVLACIQRSIKVYSIWTDCILVAAIIQLLFNKSTLIRKWIFSFILLFEQKVHHPTHLLELSLFHCDFSSRQIHDLHTFPGRWFMTNCSSSADIQPINVLIRPAFEKYTS